MWKNAFRLNCPVNISIEFRFQQQSVLCRLISCPTGITLLPSQISTLMKMYLSMSSYFTCCQLHGSEIATGYVVDHPAIDLWSVLMIELIKRGRLANPPGNLRVFHIDFASTRFRVDTTLLSWNSFTIWNWSEIRGALVRRVLIYEDSMYQSTSCGLVDF